MAAPKREKMTCQRSIAQEKKRERGSHVWKKEEVIISGMIKREREPTLEGVNHTIIHYPSIHTPTHSWSRLYDLFLHKSSLWLYNIWNASMPCFYPTLSSTKDLSTIGKTEGRYCPGEDNKSWVLRENHFWELSHVFENLLQKYLQINCRSMNKCVLLCKPF